MMGCDPLMPVASAAVAVSRLHHVVTDVIVSVRCDMAILRCI